MTLLLYPRKGTFSFSLEGATSATIWWTSHHATHSLQRSCRLGHVKKTTERIAPNWLPSIAQHTTTTIVSVPLMCAVVWIKPSPVLYDVVEPDEIVYVGRLDGMEHSSWCQERQHSQFQEHDPFIRDILRLSTGLPLQNIVKVFSSNEVAREAFHLQIPEKIVHNVIAFDLLLEEIHGRQPTTNQSASAANS